MKGWTRFNKYLYKYWKLQAAVIALGIVAVPLTLLNPYLTKLVIDRAYGDKDLTLFFMLAAIGGTVFILTGLTGSFSAYLSRAINRNVHFDMTRDLFSHFQRLPLSFFDDHSTGEHIYRLNSDVRSVSDFVCNTVPQMVTIFPRLIFIIAIVFHLNRRLAVFAAMLVPVTYIHPFIFGRWLREISRSTIQRSQGIFKELQEVFSHIHLIKAVGMEAEELRKFEENLARRRELELRNAKVSNIGGFSSSMINKALSGVIALYGGYQVIKGTMTLGSLTAIMIYVAQMVGLLKSIGGFYQTVTVSSVTRQRLAEILDIRPYVSGADGSVPCRIEEGSIEFRDVVFGYKEGDQVLKGISFSISPAAKAAFVGPSGCGKTTILSLILGLYEHKEGAIYIDGRDTRKVRLDSMRSGIGVALQEPFLWNDTIRNNILYGAAGDATFEDVVRAARTAEAHGFISGLPDGYDSVIGEMACKLSEGQKQRIAVARAVIKKPRILLLDEAMSSLDSGTEDKVMENIRRDFGGSTVLCISHRLSAVKKMDIVYFMEDGSRMETGVHDDLLADPGYGELFAGQLEDPRRECIGQI